MYRAEAIFKEIQNQPLNYPICIPSYNRPDSPFMRWVYSDKFDIPKDNIYVFIRNTPEQKSLYKQFTDRVNIVLISADTKNLGDTRAQIVNWGVKHNHELIFMLDDTINGVWWLTSVERKDKLYLDISKQSTPKTAFQIWAKEHLSHQMVATSVSSKGFHWMSDRVDKSIEPLSGASAGLANCIAISPVKLKSLGINYQSIDDVGAEDAYMLHMLLTHKQPFCQLTDICFQIKTVSFGGDNDIHPGQSRMERLLRVKKLFWEKTLGLQWGEKHPGYRVIKGRSESDNIKLNLSYWREFYENTK